ncbi:hypothetical protein [Sphingobium sp. YBL2]|uniref:hypothetical protein n=1 Tax=Sphingobium sp. (strain YBL2) TaxID=484429 RepID=UPI0005CBC881|nr:hypothetical protein [Sphingobium sp. YBL2]AJR26841.1 hypothetical protein TZ53_23710 [Sphingobium sp. YBL2]
MLILPSAIKAIVAREAFAKAGDADLEMRRRLPPVAVPQKSYLEFVTTWGYVRFELLDDPCEFTFAYDAQDAATNLRSSVSMFMAADKVAQYYQGLVLDVDDDLPKFPAHMLPICFTPGPSHALLEFGAASDVVWFWDFEGEPWHGDTGVNLGFVAPTFQALLEGLRVPAP